VLADIAKFASQLFPDFGPELNYLRKFFSPRKGPATVYYRPEDFFIFIFAGAEISLKLFPALHAGIGMIALVTQLSANHTELSLSSILRITLRNPLISLTGIQFHGYEST